MPPLIGCALCGKWSSPSSFPAGPGNDFPVKAVKGRGRGKGFDVLAVRSGLDDRDLSLAVKRKMLSLAGVLAKRGYLSRGEMEAVLGRPELVPDLESALTEARKWKSRASEFAKNKERVESELSSTTRILLSVKEDLRRTQRDEEHLKVEVAEARRRLSRTSSAAELLQRRVKDLESELASARDGGDSSLEATQWGDQRSGSTDYHGALRGLLKAIEPLIEQVEYIAMDDPELAERLETAQKAVNRAGDLLRDDAVT